MKRSTNILLVFIVLFSIPATARHETTPCERKKVSCRHSSKRQETKHCKRTKISCRHGSKKIVSKKLYCEDAFIDTRDEYITVWIHGIKLIGTNYYKRGLNHPANFERGRNLRRLGASLLETFNNTENTADNVLIYSWSARYRVSERKKAAQELYDLLVQKVEEYKAKYKKDPKIRLIAFSEGGNVTLALGEVPNTHHLSIAECIIMGTPIQRHTSCYIESPLFERILYLYSLGDIVQIIAPQLYFIPLPGCPHFSERRFYERKNLIQVETHINGLSKGHFAFIQKPFIKMLPLIIKTLNELLDAAPEPNKRPFYELIVYTHPKRR